MRNWLIKMIAKNYGVIFWFKVFIFLSIKWKFCLEMVLFEQFESWMNNPIIKGHKTKLNFQIYEMTLILKWGFTAESIYLKIDYLPPFLHKYKCFKIFTWKKWYTFASIKLIHFIFIKIVLISLKLIMPVHIRDRLKSKIK